MSSHWHSQIQPDAPRPSLSPLDTLTHKVTDSHSTWDDHMPKIMGISSGFLCALYHNYVRVKPPFASKGCFMNCFKAIFNLNDH